MKPAIHIEDLGKVYRVRKNDQPNYRSLRETLSNIGLAAIHRWRYRAEKRRQEDFWALRGVSFAINPGEVVGIVGRNGAGKSTLLKILSRITKPSRGTVELRGRVGSLLEVGTGFHPELTGRENIFLNGSILGMGRREITRRFDDIVSFSGVERFLDTPVKRYSSGMHVRLAFAVAAHLEPAILLVDEVLAVGDLAFQHKCLNHMRLLTRSGMTIVLVSHNMAAIQSCCRRALFLEAGTLAADGPPVAIIDQYRVAMQGSSAYSTGDAQVKGAQDVSIVGFEMFGEDGRPTREIRFGESVRIRIDLHAQRRVHRPIINFGVKRGDGVIVCNFNNWYDECEIDFIEGYCALEGWLPPLRILPDFFEIHALVWPRADPCENMIGLQPLVGGTFGHFRVIGPALQEGHGVFQMPARKWQLTRDDGSIVFDVRTDNRLSHIV
jgi:lipopolysaccharide transport system ATP-binding protein